MREPQLAGQTVVVIGGSAGIGYETARLAGADGAKIVLTGRNPQRLERAATELGATSSIAFDASDTGALNYFFKSLPAQIDHVMVTAGGPYYAKLADLDRDQARRDFEGTSMAGGGPGAARRRPGAARNCAPLCRSGAWWVRPTSRPSPST